MLGQYQPKSTIAAISTAPGEGGLSVVRIVGDDAIAIANKVFSGNVLKYKTHTVHYGRIIDKQGEVVDNALLTVMLGSKSYTGEDTVEISCHGGPLVTRKVLDCIIQAGCRHAMPGEFTFKAFINKKLDLVQAEAVQELISAKNEKAVKAAKDQLSGKLSERILDLKSKLTDIAGMLEAWVDFPEEDIEFASIDSICADLEETNYKIDQLVKTFHDGKKIHDGVSLCLIGRTNVGKSSLMNALLDKDRAIVTDIHGTTRDILEDEMILNGLNIRLMDSAGIRNTTEIIEQEGVRRSKKAMLVSDIILLVLDASEGLLEEDIQIMKEIPKNKTLIVWNKMDLVNNRKLPKISMEYVESVSALKNTGIADLKKCIDRMIWKHGPPSKEEIIITNIRHKEALMRSSEACSRVIEGLKNNVSPEFVSFDMRQSLTELGKIIGTDVTEDILSSIFSRFCIGK